jgi:sigma-B regulation protein RsbU (phosphoserine phosphatase)
MRIYVADDSEDARYIMAAALSSGGYEDVTFAESGLELMARLGIDPPSLSAPEADLILLDVTMPGPDGIETCARLRADPRYHHTPILMITSLDDMDTLKNAFVAGANDFINKPLNRIELHARIRCALRYKGELDRRKARDLSSQQRYKGEFDRRNARDPSSAQRPLSAGGANEARLDPETLLVAREWVENYIAHLDPNAFKRMGILALQMDRLPHFQNHYGPLAAQDALSRIARVLSSLAGRLGDLLSHFDKGVFVALLHDIDQVGLALAARNARQAVCDLSIRHRGSGSDDIVTVSVGVACDREPRALLPAAVSAMERAAGEGGDRILFA